MWQKTGSVLRRFAGLGKGKLILPGLCLLWTLTQIASVLAASVSSDASRAPTTVTGAPNSPTAARLRGLAFDHINNRLFAVGYVENQVTAFRDDGASLTPLANISVGPAPFGIGIVDNKVYVSNSPDALPSSISVINATTLQKITDISIDVNECGGQAAHIAVNPLTHRVYVAMHAVSGPVVVIDSQIDAVLTCVPTNTGAFGIAAHPASNSIFVGSRDGRDLWRSDGAANTSAQVVSWFVEPGGGSPYYVGISLTANRLYAMVGTPNSDVPDKLYAYSVGGSGQLTGVAGSPVIVGNTDDGGYVLQSDCPGNPIYVAVTNIVASTGNNTVVVRNSDLSPKTVITVGPNPLALTESISAGRIYVGNKGTNTISVIQSCYRHYLPMVLKSNP